MNSHIALAGNPNSGKTTLFNRLTGTRQTTGNWPGVTVEKKVGVIRHHGHKITIVDLPGIYSLSPYSLEEIVTRNYILEDKPDVIVNIIDATNLERNLYFTLQLKKLGRPMLVALNMMDEVISHGDKLDVARLSELLDLPVIPISAKKNAGITALLDQILAVDSTASPDSHGQRHHHILTESPRQAEDDHRQDQPATLAVLPASYVPETDAETAAMFQEAAAIHDAVLVHSHPPDALSRSDRIDQVLTHRFLALPIFLLVMLGVFQVTFHENLGGRLTSWLDSFFSDRVSGLVSNWLTAAQAPAWIHSLLVEGIIAGVGGILTFLPQITLLFLFLSVLEETGYMARAAFIVDRIFRQMGLSGRSFIPMLMGFGCTVPAVMAARSLENERDRRLTIMIIPYMSCGARMPIYAFFSAIFFSQNKGLVTFSMYWLGILVAVLSALLVGRTVLRGQESNFLIELPPYRLPDAKSLALHVWDKVRDFIIRAGTLIFIMTVIVWFFQHFSFSLQTVTDNDQSIFGRLGSLVAPLLRPLGFGTWQASVALLTGLIAKETVVASLKILYTPAQLTQWFTPLSAYAFMTFTLLYTPCVAALGAIHRELNSWRWTLLTVAYQIGVAYLLALLVFQGGRLLGLG